MREDWAITPRPAAQVTRNMRTSYVVALSTFMLALGFLCGRLTRWTPSLAPSVGTEPDLSGPATEAPSAANAPPLTAPPAPSLAEQLAALARDLAEMKARIPSSAATPEEQRALARLWTPVIRSSLEQFKATEFRRKLQDILRDRIDSLTAATQSSTARASADTQARLEQYRQQLLEVEAAETIDQLLQAASRKPLEYEYRDGRFDGYESQHDDLFLK